MLLDVLQIWFVLGTDVGRISYNGCLDLFQLWIGVVIVLKRICYVLTRGLTSVFPAYGLGLASSSLYLSVCLFVCFSKQKTSNTLP